MRPLLQVVKTDPDVLPLTECHGATNVALEMKALSELENFQGDAVVFVCLDRLVPEAADFDEKRGGILTAAMQEADFENDSEKCIGVRCPNGKGPIHLFAIGTGKHNGFDPAAAGEAVADAIRKRNSITSVGIYIPNFCKNCPCPAAPAVFMRKLQAVLETFMVGLDSDKRFKGSASKNLKKTRIEKLTIFTADMNGTLKVAETAKLISRGVHTARELVNAPANFCTTVALARVAEQIAEEGGLSCKILGLEEIEALGMGSYLAVSKGSFYPPQFIHLTYTGDADAEVNLHRMALVGKGLCFDSGGYNIKRAETSIELMKFDMGGAAAVLGAAKAIAACKPPNVEVHFIIAAAENMVSSRAYRPGDVITASNGVTIEVGNTDAEGRLTLADALVYAENLGVDSIVDIATLTGACIIALGESYAGMWASNKDMADCILNSAENAGEKIWQLPLVSNYKKLLESECADINNVGGKGKGGAITAALFLKEFVKKTPWAHIDIAGPAWCQKTSSATGYGVRTLVEYIHQRSSYTKGV